MTEPIVVDLLSLEDLFYGDASYANSISEEKQRVYQMIARVCGKLYGHVKWNKMKTKKGWKDIFEHRIKKSARQPSVSRFISRVCSQLKVSHLYEDPEVIMMAERDSDLILATIRKETQMAVMLAVRYNEIMRDRRAEDNLVKDEKILKKIEKANKIKEWASRV